jgi:hypothetical protein
MERSALGSNVTILNAHVKNLGLSMLTHKSSIRSIPIFALYQCHSMFLVFHGNETQNELGSGSEEPCHKF